MSPPDFLNMCLRAVEKAEHAADSTEATILLWKRGFGRIDALEKRLDALEKSTPRPDC